MKDDKVNKNTESEENLGFMKEKRMYKHGGVLGWEFQMLMA